MKRKTLLLLLIIVTAAVSAFVIPKAKAECEYYTQYYWNGSQYVVAPGYEGEYWVCIPAAGTCTYWQPTPGNFQPCHIGGQFQLIDP